MTESSINASARVTIAFIAMGVTNALQELLTNKPDVYEELTDGLGQTGIMDEVTQHYWIIEHIWKTKVDKNSLACIWDYDVSEEFGKTFIKALASSDCPPSYWDGAGVEEFIMNIVNELVSQDRLQLITEEKVQ